VIVRLMGEGQYRVDDSLLEQLNELDDRAIAAIEAGNEIDLDEALDGMAGLVRSQGQPLADDEIATSDALVPPSDMSLEEARQFLSDEGFVPDLPAPPE
jgi:hypothetical protein